MFPYLFLYDSNLKNKSHKWFVKSKNPAVLFQQHWFSYNQRKTNLWGQSFWGFFPEGIQKNAQAITKQAPCYPLSLDLRNNPKPTPDSPAS